MNHIDLSTITLATGSHSARSKQGCLLEWVALFAEESKSDSPACTSPVLAAFGRAWNDGLDATTRQRLIPYIPRLVGTAGDPEADERRAWLATDWLVHVQAVAWLRLAKLTEHADALAALPPILSSAAARSAQGTLTAARDAAGAAAGAAARAAARDAARAALKPTVEELQASAFDLFDRMIEVKVAIAA